MDFLVIHLLKGCKLYEHIRKYLFLDYSETEKTLYNSKYTSAARILTANWLINITIQGWFRLIIAQKILKYLGILKFTHERKLIEVSQNLDSNSKISHDTVNNKL